MALTVLFALTLSAVLVLRTDAQEPCPAHPSGLDLNGDCKVDSGDQGTLAVGYGDIWDGVQWVPGPHHPTETPTSTATSTSTASPTPSSTLVPPNTPTPTFAASPTVTVSPSPSGTPTPTPVPTATNTPSGYTVADLLNDSVGPHDIDPCGTGDFDWENHGVVQSVGPSGRNSAGGWFAYQWDCGGPYSPITVSLRNLKAFAWTGSAWVQYEGNMVSDPTGIDWCNMMYPPGGHPDQFGPGCALGSEVIWNMPYQIESGHVPAFQWPRSIHGATSFVAFPPGTQCLVTTGEARQSGSAPLALHFGADWGNGGQTAGGAVVGRFKMLTTSYVFFGAASCPASTLNAHPPPGVSP